MTRKEFCEKYGSVKVTFSYYYKFSFNFKGSLPDGSIITCAIGGNSAEIYRQEVAAKYEYTIQDLDPYSGNVIRPDGTEVESFYDF